MIGPEQRVSKPACKSSGNVATTMGKRRRRTGRPEEQRYRDDRNFIVPASLSELATEWGVLESTLTVAGLSAAKPGM